jgi:hypothetical protein
VRVAERLHLQEVFLEHQELLMLKSQSFDRIDFAGVISVVAALDHAVGALSGLLPHCILLVEERGVCILLVGGDFFEAHARNFFVANLDAGPALTPLDLFL